MAPKSLLFAGLAGLVASEACKGKPQFDGRVPQAFTLDQFDKTNGIFNPSNVFGKGLKLSEELEFPKVCGSLFDKETKPVGVTINDKSIFAPSANNVQVGFRRLELLPANNDGTDASTEGIKTLHFSVMKDPQRPLNLTHEYQLVFLESADFSTNQFVLKTGSILGQNTADPDTLQIFSNVAEQPVQTLFATPFTADVFHNFALTLDFTKNTTQVFYSTGKNPLEAQTQAVSNIISGKGQHHFGMLKKGLQSDGDITKTGIQESGINEGIIYGGIFDEDSSDGCITLQ